MAQTETWNRFFIISEECYFILKRRMTLGIHKIEGEIRQYQNWISMELGCFGRQKKTMLGVCKKYLLNLKKVKKPIDKQWSGRYNKDEDKRWKKSSKGSR